MRAFISKVLLSSIFILCAIVGLSGQNAFAGNADLSYFESYNRITPISMHPLYQSDATSKESGSSFLEDFDFGTVHKIIGYSALASGATAGVTGYLITKKFDSGKSPSGTLSSLHSASAGGAIGLGVSAALSGLWAYSGMISFKNGISTYNTHMILGTLSALGFIAAAAFAPEGNSGSNSKKNSSSVHCNIAKASGATMFATVLVIQF